MPRCLSIQEHLVELLEKAEESSTKSIPEPSATFGLLTLGICGLVKGKK